MPKTRKVVGDKLVETTVEEIPLEAVNRSILRLENMITASENQISQAQSEVVALRGELRDLEKHKKDLEKNKPARPGQR